MSFKLLNLLKCSRTLCRNVHSSAVKLNESSASVIIKKSENFTLEEELFIVETVNRCSLEDFKNYDIKMSQLKKLLHYKEKNGRFETFNDVLSTQEVPSFVRFCKSILNGGKQPVKSAEKKLIRKGIINPPINDNSKEMIKSAVGLSVWKDSICWAKLENTGELKDWKYIPLDVPPKNNIVPLINYVVEQFQQMPNSDAYIMESDVYLSLNKLKGSIYQSHIVRHQIIATIVSIIEMRRRYKFEESFLHHFYSLQPLSVAKKFHLKVGSESVASEIVVKDILDNGTHENLHKSLHISIDPILFHSYYSYTPIIREQLNSPFLTALLFLDLLKS